MTPKVEKYEKILFGELGYRIRELDDKSGELVTAEEEEPEDDLEFDIDENSRGNRGNNLHLYGNERPAQGRPVHPE